ncbi:hypothetical protein TD95_003724 [Thielaviopsis punctulata]|uniref:BCAS3 domain-containing protein n=1 Tax=Thielaviopsis punctulata TaxID=72032 RepID=A0A0F4ZDI3_9PEZI|nr:hypothetical protein TD95_003724 [Thielaviopsis punctulata]
MAPPVNFDQVHSSSNASVSPGTPSSDGLDTGGWTHTAAGSPASTSYKRPNAIDVASTAPSSVCYSSSQGGIWPHTRSIPSSKISDFPRTAYSYQTYGSHASSDRLRRGSSTSQSSHARMPSSVSSPPQSHQHYYGTPDYDLDHVSGIRAGDRGYYYGFDSIPKKQSDRTLAAGTEKVILAGFEGGLEVRTIMKHDQELLYRLSGLRGGVLNAKVLPWTTEASQDKSPLVAVVVHGPMVSEKQASFTQYQTTVEVHSLLTGEKIDVLIKMPPIPIPAHTSITDSNFEPPMPNYTLSLLADSGYVVVASGQSGETWVFSQIPFAHPSGGRFGCAAKLWTSVQQRLRNDVMDEAHMQTMQQAAKPAPRYNALQPIVSLGGHWLAYCPPAPSSQLATNVEIPVSPLGKAPGLQHGAPPSLPAASTGVDQPLAEGLMNKIVRGTAQEFIHGTKWVGQQGRQAWNSYWAKPNANPSMARSPPTQTWGSSYPPKSCNDFPPTHGVPGFSATSKEPGLVCLVDLKNLGNASNLYPFSTFMLAGGCSYLSFAPAGMSLFTASSKGDVQTVWDLMRTQHTKSSLIQVSPGAANNSSLGVHVRQVAYFSRMTEARIVDVAWTRPNGERIAMVTERGTVHLLDMPSSAYAWPPPRRRADDSRSVAEPVSDSSGSTAVALASTALGVAFGAARPLINRSRRSSGNVQSQGQGQGQGGSSGSFVESASQGGRMIAASISSSIGKTGQALNQLRQSGENRVTLPSQSSSRPPATGCVTWVLRHNHHALFVAGNGLVRTFPSKSRRMSSTVAASSSAASHKSRFARENAYRDYNVLMLPDNKISDYISSLLKSQAQSDEEFNMEDLDMVADADTGNTVVLDLRKPVTRPCLEATIPEAEIESSAPYQPFHTDRRITVYEYQTSGQYGRSSLTASSLDRPTSVPRSLSTGSSGGIWAFGQPMATTKLSLDVPEGYEDDLAASLEDHRALPASAMERTLQQVDGDEQIIITTRRRRGARYAAAVHDEDDDGFFEDDCEVLDFADQRV